MAILYKKRIFAIIGKTFKMLLRQKKRINYCILNDPFKFVKVNEILDKPEQNQRVQRKYKRLMQELNAEVLDQFLRKRNYHITGMYVFSI
jgi:hypothetical protein